MCVHASHEGGLAIAVDLGAASPRFLRAFFGSDLGIVYRGDEWDERDEEGGVRRKGTKKDDGRKCLNCYAL